jgi:tetratricopeptide (TPR) repeat protein
VNGDDAHRRPRGPCGWPACALVALALGTSSVFAQDAVIIAGQEGRPPVTRRGEIVELTGTELRLKTAAGRIEPIPRERVVELTTKWTEAHAHGDALRQAGKLDEAITAYQQAKEQESRPWARRQIAAAMVGCYVESGRFDLAGDEFLTIVAADPTTQHFDVIPLAWRSFPPDAVLEARAEKWLAAGQRNPVAALLGASWLLSTSRRAAAIEVLEELSSRRGLGEDQRLAQLANVQLWRSKIVTAAAGDVSRWKAAVERMSAETQGSGWYVVADALARLGQHEEAALAYLRVPILHGQQRVMAADALVAAGKQLESLGRSAQAAGLYREVLRDFAFTPAAGEAKARLAAK